MGLLNDLRRGLSVFRDTGIPPIGLASPMAPRPNHLNPIVLADMMGTDTPRGVSRDSAMKVPAVARARALVCTTIARLPLEAIRDGEPLEHQPKWINRTTDRVYSPYHRMLWTADDLLFYGWSLWAVSRDSSGQVLDAARVPYESWEVDDATGQVLVNKRVAREDEVIIIPGIHDGILSHGDEAILQYVDLLHAAAKAASMPNAMIELHQTNDRPLTQDEVNNLVAQYATARRGRNGGIAVTTNGVESKEVGSIKEHLLTDGRNAAAIDIARLCGIPSTMIDCSISGSSLSYSNPDSRMSELITFGIAPLLAAIAGRLGMDDVVPRGVGMQFDTAYSLAPITEVTPPDDGAFKTTDPERAALENVGQGI